MTRNCDGTVALEAAVLFKEISLTEKAEAPKPMAVLLSPFDDRRSEKEHWSRNIVTKKKRISSADDDNDSVVLDAIAGIALTVNSTGWHAKEL